MYPVVASWGDFTLFTHDLFSLGTIAIGVWAAIAAADAISLFALGGHLPG